MKLTKRSMILLIVAVLFWLVSAILSDAAPGYENTSMLLNVVGGLFGMLWLFTSFEIMET
jgi:capsular polysaccharide biosynthesis protein